MWKDKTARKENEGTSFEGSEDSASIKKARELAAEANEVFITKNDYETAIRLYTQAIALQPSEVRFFGNRSMGYLLEGKLDAALADARTCVRLKPDWPKGFFIYSFIIA